MDKISLLLLYCTGIGVITGQTLPTLETLPPDLTSNTSVIISPFDETCMMSDNSTDQDNVVFLGAVALNTANECEVICQRQVLQQFALMFAGIIRTRAVIIGNVFTASMPDNSPCNTTGTCTGGMCSVSTNSTSGGISETTTMMTNSTETTTMASNVTTVMTNSTGANTTAV